MICLFECAVIIGATVIIGVAAIIGYHKDRAIAAIIRIVDMIAANIAIAGRIAGRNRS